MTIKERMEIFIERQGIKRSVFEKSCGFSNGYIRNLKENPSASKIEDILSAYPEISRVWLLSGEGEMLNSTKPNEQLAAKSEMATSVLLIPISAQGGSLNEFVVSIKDSDCERVVSPIRGADFAIQVSGDSMAPEYPNGSRVFIKKINERAFIEWGKTYVLDTCNGTVIKTLVPSDDKDSVRCISINPDPIYAPFDVRFEDMYGLYKVMLCMSVK